MNLTPLEEEMRGPQGLAAVSVTPEPGRVDLDIDNGRYHDGGGTQLSPDDAVELAIQLLETARDARILGAAQQIGALAK